MQARSSNTGVTRPRAVRVQVLIAALLAGIIALFLGCSGGPAGGEAPHSADSLELAAGFSLPDQFGETYSFEPGDGRDHVFVFYMGYF